MALPSGFSYAATTAGIKASGSKDLGLIYLPQPGVMGAVYTVNRFPAAPVLYNKGLTPNADFRAMIVNSGVANAATGALGETNNRLMVEALAETMELQPDQILTASTGVIGQQLPMDLIKNALPALKENLNEDPQGFAEAILTTDLKSKSAQSSFTWEGNEYHIYGCSKGSGMIHPNMATMLGYVMTDAPMSAANAQEIAKYAADRSFNSMSVDGDTSTNDSFHVISSAPAEGLDAACLAQVKEEITKIAIDLARLIAEDGEGAEHLMIVEVQGAASEQEAHSVMSAIATSSLVKTAVHGCDPNWGRILMAVGNGILSMVDNPPIDIQFQGVNVFQGGEPQAFDRPALATKMKDFNVLIHVNLHLGEHSAKGFGCDLSREYIRINADYTT